MHPPDLEPTLLHTPAVGPPPDPGSETQVFAPDGGDPGRTSTFGAAPRPAGSGAPAAVPGFEIVRELGRGGMGVVYLARQVRLNREVALKMVLGGGHASASDLARFLAEAEAGAAVPHSGVVQVYESGQHDGLPYFALEYCPGGSLAEKLAGTPLAPAAAAELAGRLARAVQAAHEQGIVHRDLKPANVLFAADGTPKIADFGLARRGATGSGLTATGAILGTPSYMAPEQAAGQKDVGPGADVYALGAILYECLTGRPPFRAATPMETVMQVARDEPVPPSRLAPRLPRDLETICLKCLAKDPRRRYPTAAALADDLDRFRDGRSILARPAPAWERAWKAARRRPAVAASLAAVVVAVAAVVGVVLVANAELQRERDVARQAEDDATTQRDNALAARAEADAAKRKAHDHLEAALAAVDRMMVRVAGEQWAANPALQDERKAVLEEAIAVYQGLLKEDSRDPHLRRQAARAHMQVAGLYLALADYPSCRKAAEAAAELYRGLAAEFPADPAPLRGEAEAAGLLGAIAVLAADYDGSRAHYERALDLAERAIRLDPAAAESLLALAGARTQLGHYHGRQNPPLAADYHAKALAVATDLAGRPGAPFEHRLALAGGLVNVAALEFGLGQPGPAGEMLGRAGELLEQLGRERPPTARVAETLTQTRAAWAVLRGQALFRAGRRDDGLRLVADGLREFDRLLAAHPRSFPVRMSRLQYSAVYSELLRQAGRAAEARQALDEFVAGQDALARDYPGMPWVRGIAPGYRSLWLVDRARVGECPDPDAEFQPLVESAPPSLLPVIRYNLACAHAQQGAAGPTDRKEGHAARAVAILTDLLAGAYFRNPANVAHLDKDTDLDPLRDRDDFKAFLEEARKLPPPKQP